MKTLRAGLFVTLLLPVAALAQPTSTLTGCPAERAVYTMATEGNDHVVHLIPAQTRAGWSSDLYLRLTTPQRDYWFVFGVSASQGNMTLLPVGDPYAPEARVGGPANLIEAFRSRSPDAFPGELPSLLRFYVLDAELGFTPAQPQQGQPAPAFLLMPELNTALWYHLPALTDDPSAERDPMPRGIFRLTECLDTTPPAAFP
ncbi:hypothetical protein [Sinisalibacter aestuarii]|uniref:DOMON-like domain-containing protein n=1 Tax=Sinisalibacter aestuarii TaxID=2949426 RepID=A0ABQ5LS02_9RHOB|nr:hypothetical protein [Sinisalibacter aestuarii]GKY86857.1 hypothetical protein STA1M1_07260 [Sinisalibacter aestuarii]